MAAEARARLSALSTPADKATTSYTGKPATGVIMRKVWSGGDGVDDMGSPSPDGRYLSFTDWSTGDLAVRDLVTGMNRRLTNKNSWNVSGEYPEFSRVSPDGKQIAFTWFGKGYDLRIVGLDGSNLRVLYRNPELSYVQPSSWSPDGKHVVAVLTRLDHTNQIALVSVAEASVRVLKTVDWREPQMLSMSPDGRWIAYDFPQTEESLQRDIFLLATDGSQETRVVEHPAHDFLLGWSPDGERLVFASDRTGSISVWAIQIAAGKPQGEAELIRRDLGQILPLGLTGDGILFYSSGWVRDVYMGEFDLASVRLGAAKNATSRYVGTNYLPKWSPDGEYLAFISRRGPPRSGIDSRVLVIQSVKTGEERVLAARLSLPLNPNPRLGLAWSPDGRFIAVHAEGTSLVGRNIETSEEKIVYSPRHIGNVVTSPDNRQLAFCASDPSGKGPEVLVVMPVSGREPTVLFRAPKDERFNAIVWTPDGRHLLFMTDPEPIHRKQKQVWRVSVAGGKAEPTPLHLMPQQLGGLSFHPDGKRVAFTELSKSGLEILAM